MDVQAVVTISLVFPVVLDTAETNEQVSSRQRRLFKHAAESSISDDAVPG